MITLPKGWTAQRTDEGHAFYFNSELIFYAPIRGGKIDRPRFPSWTPYEAEVLALINTYNAMDTIRYENSIRRSKEKMAESLNQWKESL